MKVSILSAAILLAACGQTNRGSISYPSCTVSTVLPTNTTPGGSLIACPDGSQSLLHNGAAGSNAFARPVKLCPGDTVYPSKFVEIAFCIEHKLYAVYSINDGFLTEVPPGTYNSHALNSSCNFTVLADCEIML